MSEDAKHLLGLQSDYINVFFASLALIVYDTSLTFDKEINYIWRAKFSGVTVLYGLNRYLYIFSNILSIAQLWSERSKESCLTYLYIDNIAQIMILLSNAAFFSLRIWAVWGRRWSPFFLVLLVSLVPVWLNLSRLSAVRFIGIDNSLRAPYGGCQWDSNLPEDGLRLAASSRIVTMLCDGLVLILTWAKTLELRRKVNQRGAKTDLTTLLNRDGTVYFGALLALNITTVVLDNSTVEFNPAMILCNAFTSMLISRFILNLRNLSFRRQYNPKLEDEDEEEDESYNEPVVLSTVFGSCGAPLSQGSIPSEYNWTWSDSRENLLSDPLMSGLYEDNMSDITYRGGMEKSYDA